MFEFPVTTEEVLEAIVSGISVNTISERALSCILSPSLQNLPEVWIINIILSCSLVIALANGVHRDRAELRFVEALLRGKRADARRRVVNLVKRAAIRARAEQAKRPVRDADLRRSRASSMLTMLPLMRRRSSVSSTNAPTPAVVTSKAQPLQQSREQHIARRLVSGTRLRPPPIAARRSRQGCDHDPALVSGSSTTVAHALGIQGAPAAADALDPNGPDHKSMPAGTTAPAVECNDETGSESKAETNASIADGPVASQCVNVAGMACTVQPAGAHHRASRTQADVLGIFGTVKVSPESLSVQNEGVARSTDETSAPQVTRAAVRWRQARLAAQQEVLVKRWHKDVNRGYKRLWLSFKGNHTMLAGVFYRGTGGYTRAETIMVLMNSLALEIVVLCMFYSMPSNDSSGPSPLVINPVQIAVNGTLCAIICIPAMLVLAWLFQPQAALIFLAWLARLVLLGPRLLARLLAHYCKCQGRCKTARVAPNRAPAAASWQLSPTPSLPPSPPELPSFPMSLSRSMYPSLPPSPPPGLGRSSCGTPHGSAGARAALQDLRLAKVKVRKAKTTTAAAGKAMVAANRVKGAVKSSTIPANAVCKVSPSAESTTSQTECEPTVDADAEAVVETAVVAATPIDNERSFTLVSPRAKAMMHEPGATSEVVDEQPANRVRLDCHEDEALLTSFSTRSQGVESARDKAPPTLESSVVIRSEDSARGPVLTALHKAQASNLPVHDHASDDNCSPSYAHPSAAVIQTRLTPAPIFSLPPSPSPPNEPSNRRGLSERSAGLRKLLKRAVTSLAPRPTERKYSHESLDDHLLKQSLTRNLKLRNGRAVVRILSGWLLSYVCFIGLLLTFSLYGCEIYFFATKNDVTGTELLLSWAWSIFQRFIVNEPILIILGKVVPLLFSSALCTNVCGETVVNVLGYVVAGVSQCLKALRR